MAKSRYIQPSIPLIRVLYPPTPARAAPRSSVHVCSPLSTTRPLPFLQIAIGPRLPHPFYCSGISPPPPGTRRSHSAVLGTTSRPRLLDPFHLSGISMVVELFKGSFKGTPMSAPPAIGPRLPHPFYCSGISPPPPGTRRSHSAVLGTTSRPRLLDPFHLSGISMVVELFKGSFKGTPMSAPPAIGSRLPHPFYCSGISPPPPGTRRSHSALLGTTA